VLQSGPAIFGHSCALDIFLLARGAFAPYKGPGYSGPFTFLAALGIRGAHYGEADSAGDTELHERRGMHDEIRERGTMSDGREIPQPEGPNCRGPEAKERI
jgi:hypothetical protein